MRPVGYSEAMTTTTINRRRAARADVQADMLMTDGAGRLSGLQLLNLSASGFMGVADVDLCEREFVRVDMPVVGWVDADIVWVLGGKIGAAFHAGLAAHELRTILDDATR